MRVGLILNHEEEPGGVSPRWDDVRGYAQDAEGAGVDSLWIADHFVWDGDPWGRDPVGQYGSWEAWTTLAALASATSRVSLGTLVTCTGYRNPALLAKMADSVDQMSGGRLVLGLGAGDAPDEHARFGFDADRRVARFSEALEVIVPLLRTGSVEFSGEFYRVPGAELRPRPPASTGPPILIGSLAHRPRMLSLVARHADIWNGWMTKMSDPADIRPLRAAVDEACAAIGRDPASLARSIVITVAYGPAPHQAITGTTAEIAAAIRAFEDEGIDEVQVRLFPNDRDSVARFAPVLEAMH